MDSTPADPCPALSRGLALLGKLERDGAASLERLTRDLALPKSSVARLLRTLEAAGAVWRDPITKRYHARLRLAPVADPGAALRAGFRAVADELTARCVQTVELHRFDGRTLTMIDRLEPDDSLVTAKARIGFQRSFDEVDALTQLVLAHGLPESDWPGGRNWSWQSGRKQPVAKAKRSAMVDTARRTGVALDTDVNEQGIFRYAAPVLDGEKLIAVLAVAQVCLAGTRVPDSAIAHRVADAGRSLSIPHRAHAHAHRLP